MELADYTNEIMDEIEVTLIFNLRSLRRMFVDVRYNFNNCSTYITLVPYLFMFGQCVSQFVRRIGFLIRIGCMLTINIHNGHREKFFMLIFCYVGLYD